MKLTYLATATAAVALLGGAAFAQDPAKTETPPAAEAAPPADTPPATDAAPPADTAAPPADTSTTASTSTDVTAPAATTASANASFTTMTVTNGPVPDTKENRAKYGQPMSRAGKMTAAKGN
jgi:hypothetical protein